MDFTYETTIDSPPLHVFMNILERLHWVDYMRCKLVSHSWNSILKNTLLRSQSSVAISSCEADVPCLVVTIRNQIIVRRAPSISHRPASGRKRWNQLPLISPSSHPTFAQWKLIATTNGLFLMSAVHDERKYLLCNPVTRRVEQLPRLPILLVSAELQMPGTYILRTVEMVTPMVTGGTESRSWPKVIAFERYSAGRGSDILNMWRFLQYDDKSSAWQVVSMIYNCKIKLKKVTTTVRLVPAGDDVHMHTREGTEDLQVEEKEVKLRNCATVGGETFILLTSVKGTSQTPYSYNTGVIGYMEQWYGSVLFNLRPYSLVEVSLYHLDMSPYLQLFQHGGSLYIVRGMARRNSKVDIWKQNSDGASWDEVTTMPDLLAEEQYKLMQPEELFRLQAEGDYVCFCSGNCFGVIITFHVPTKVWAVLDDFTVRLREFYSHSRFGPWLPYGQESEYSLHHFFWQPRLDSNVYVPSETQD